LEFGTQIYQLYQFSSPLFISDEKILFSARKLAASRLPDPDYDDVFSLSTGINKNTALFMSNLDGTKLERVSRKWHKSYKFKS
jgi:hypothetical protein